MPRKPLDFEALVALRLGRGGGNLRRRWSDGRRGRRSLSRFLAPVIAALFAAVFSRPARTGAGFAPRASLAVLAVFPALSVAAAARWIGARGAPARGTAGFDVPSVLLLVEGEALFHGERVGIGHEAAALPALPFSLAFRLPAAIAAAVVAARPVRLAADAPKLRELIRHGAQVLVCGGRDMADAVTSALGGVVRPLGLDLATLKSDGRYVEDVY